MLLRIRQAILALIIGLGMGALGGVIFGWFAPIQDVSAEMDKLHPSYQVEYTLMVGAAYATDGDWDKAQARLGRLALPDPAGYIVSLTEEFIVSGRNPDDIRNLARMAARFGYTTPAMLPYLPPE